MSTSPLLLAARGAVLLTGLNVGAREVAPENYKAGMPSLLYDRRVTYTLLLAAVAWTACLQKGIGLSEVKAGGSRAVEAVKANPHNAAMLACTTAAIGLATYYFGFRGKAKDDTDARALIRKNLIAAQEKTDESKEATAFRNKAMREAAFESVKKAANAAEGDKAEAIANAIMNMQTLVTSGGKALSHADQEAGLEHLLKQFPAPKEKS